MFKTKQSVLLLKSLPAGSAIPAISPINPRNTVETAVRELTMGIFEATASREAVGTSLETWPLIVHFCLQPLTQPKQFRETHL